MTTFGPVFGETILKGRKKIDSFTSTSEDRSTLRIYIFLVILIAGISVLFIRLFSLTMVSGLQYKRLSQENRIREIGLPAPRGIIYDRNKIPLVRNIPIFKTSEGEIFFTKPQNSKEFFSEESTREYIFGELFGNLIGFVSEVDRNDLKKLMTGDNLSNLRPFKLKDIIGKMGIEESYDLTLRGRDGLVMHEVDATGKYVRTLGRVEPGTGKSLILNVDLALQTKAAELLKGKIGAVAASNPNNGEILALYSSPSFDPNKILKAEDLESVFDNPDKPLFNRSISGVYPPGSTFKLITAIAGLESHAITKKLLIEDTGIIKVGDQYSYANWYFTQYGKTEGQVDLIKAIARSNDIYFYKAGEKTGITQLAKWAQLMGVGQNSGIDIKGEEKGLMPDPSWRRQAKDESWFLGDTYHAAIGQGDILTTPLQVNTWTNVIANNGQLCKPNLSQTLKASCRQLPIKKENIEIVKEGMQRACREGGTGWPLFNFSVDNNKLKIDNSNFLEAPVSTTSAIKKVLVTTACKTGTSEYGDPKNRTHAWFTIFAPANDPQISVTVLVEAGGEGSSVAGPIARDLLKTWFER